MSKQKRAENYGKPWTQEQLILAFELYCRIPFKNTKASSPEVRDLGSLLRRSGASVARKLGNFGAFDPELRRRNISGLAHGSRLDRQVWNEFHSDWSGLVFRAHEIRRTLTRGTGDHDLLDEPSGPSERLAISKQRIHQSFFREAVLSSYEEQCCITGLRVPECLIASHIIPWRVDEALRTDPTNGLCLSATFDRLFDSGLITIDTDLCIRVSKSLRDVKRGSTYEIIGRLHNHPIVAPYRFLPDPSHLQWHLSNVFRP